MLRQARYLILILIALALLLPGYRVFSASTAISQTSIQASASGAGETFTRRLSSSQNPTFFLEDEATYVDGQLLVQFAPDTPDEEKAEIHERLGAEVIGEIPALGIQILQVAEEATSMVFAYQAEPVVSFAEPDYLARIAGWPDGPIVSANALTTAGEALALDPNDPLFPEMWNLAKIRAPQGWDISVGVPEVKIAVIDTGVDANHPDLQGKVTAGYDFVNNDGNPADDQGHGTHVAGTAAAVTDNGIGIAGMSWEAKVMPIKSLSASGVGAHSWIANGIVWATDQGAAVINMSLGGPYTSATMQEAVNYAWDHGVVVIAAAGNSNTSNPTYPAAYENVIGVAATTQNDEKAQFSNYGSYISVASPGVGIYGTVRGGSYQTWSGTSMATPHVSGLAALLKSLHPEWTNTQIRDVIQETAADLGASGWDAIFGWGRIDAFAALNSDPVEPTATPTATATLDPTPTTAPDNLEQNLINLINGKRSELGLSALQRDERLMQAARRHSLDMADTGVCGHTGSDGSTPFDRIRDAEYPLGSASEVIACGYRNPSDVLLAWEESPSHWAILTNENFADIGCGLGETLDGTRYWTCNPARPEGNPPPPTDTPTATQTVMPDETPTATATAPPGVTPTVTASATPVPPTVTSSPTPTWTPTRTPTPVPTDPVNPETVNIIPEVEYVGWVVSNESSENHFGDDDVYAGIHGGRVYFGAIQFDLSDLPSDAKINWGRLTLTGQTRDFVGDSGSWSVSLLASDVDPGWENHGYLQIRDAQQEHLLLPILGNADLQRDVQNVFNLSEDVMGALEQRLNGTQRASFRVEGPLTGANNLFSWDSGFGTDGLGKPPILTINYTPGDGTPPPPTATPSPTPGLTDTPVDTSVVELTPPADSVGWVGSHEPNGNNFGDDDLYAGIYNANIYIAGVRFDLSSLPPNVQIVDSELLLTGQTRQYLGDTGTWQVEMLNSAIDVGWSGHTYADLNDASSIGTLEDLAEGDFTLEPDQLDVNRVNRLGLTPALRIELGARRQSTGYVAFRIVGPRTGDSNVFSWDTGYGSGGLLEPPVLKIKYTTADEPGPAPTATPTATQTPVPGDDGTGALIDAINAERSSRGLATLTVDDRLTDAAESHSKDLAENNLWSHTGSDSSTPADRMRRAGYPLEAGDEVLAANSTDIAEIVDAWMRNVRHQTILLTPDYVHVGAGHAYNPNSSYGDYWTVLVARPTEEDGGGDTPGEEQVTITPRESAVGWVVSDRPNSNEFGDDDMYAGIYNGLTYVAAVQFDLATVPAGAQITGARLTLTGQSDDYLAGNGTWAVEMLEAGIDFDWASHGYSAISNATSLGVVGNTLTGSDLEVSETNTLTFGTTLLNELESRRQGTGQASFRVVGPNAGSNDVFSWDSGYGSGGLNAPPVLTITYTTTP